MQKQRFVWQKYPEPKARPYLLESLESAVAKNTGNPIDINAWTPYYAPVEVSPRDSALPPRVAISCADVSPESEQLRLVDDDTKVSPVAQAEH